jgi:hypothetical protein
VPARYRDAATPKIQWGERVQCVQPLDKITSDITADAQPTPIFYKSLLVTAASHHSQNPAPRTGYCAVYIDASEALPKPRTDPLNSSMVWNVSTHVG